MSSKAIITGITGQDGSYLAELLLEKGHEVHGVIRRASTFNTKRIEHIINHPHQKNVATVFLHYGDLADANTIRKLLYIVEPDEIYHLGAQSHVRVSFDMPEYTANVTGLGTLRILEAIKDFQEYTGKKVKFYNAASSEMFGATPPPQDEKSPFRPQSPYAIAKVFAYHATCHYRDAYDIFAVNGILFNHESPRRGETFVTRKITRGIARIKAGLEEKIYLGNIEAKRDWGYAPEYVEAMWRMLQQETPEDFVIATGESHSVREFLQEAFRLVGINDYRRYIEVHPRYLRPAEPAALFGDATKAREKLGWESRTKFRELVRMMLEYDLKVLGLSLPSQELSLTP